jgi:hypothetical protein
MGEPLAWTLVIVWWLGSNAGQNVVVPSIPTKAACESLRAEMTTGSLGVGMRFARCVETTR